MGALAIEPKEVLRVGTPGDYAPYASHNSETTQLEGSDIDLIQAFASDKDFVIHFVPTRWANLAQDLVANKFDIAVGGISWTADRAKLALTTESYAISWKTILTHCDALGSVATYERLNQPRIHLVENQGGTNDRYTRQYLSRAQRSLFINNKDALQAVLDRRFGTSTTMVTDVEEALYQESLHPELCSNRVILPNSRSQKVFLVHPDKETLKNDFNAWLKSYQSTDTFQVQQDPWRH